MTAKNNVQVVQIPKDVCDYTKKVVRKYAGKFKVCGKDEEPPLRLLDHQLVGEHVVVPEGESPPYPYMVRKGNKYYHGFRFDMALCDEVVHATEQLKTIFGDIIKEESTFRNILGYASGPNQFESVDGGELARRLSELLLPAALKVFGEEENPEALKHSHIYSLYVNLLLPGQSIQLHLDVPELLGVDRSNCPSWLLVAAHCSGLFTKYRVRNVTSVFYPSTAYGGALGVFSPELEGHVYPVEEGLTVVLDTDTCFHHCAQARASSSEAGKGVEIPSVPPGCSVEFSQAGGRPEWKVVEGKTGGEVQVVPEKDIRFSVSCKFHIFRSEEEAAEYKNPSEKLSPEQLIQTMKEDLLARGRIPEDWAGPDCPLYKLGYAFYKEYIQSRAPTTNHVEKAWNAYI